MGVVLRLGMRACVCVNKSTTHWFCDIQEAPNILVFVFLQGYISTSLNSQTIYTANVSWNPVPPTLPPPPPPGFPFHFNSPIPSTMHRLAIHNTKHTFYSMHASVEARRPFGQFGLAYLYPITGHTGALAQASNRHLHHRHHRPSPIIIIIITMFTQSDACVLSLLSENLNSTEKTPNSGKENESNLETRETVRARDREREREASSTPNEQF